jgi:hypothetical protein
MLLDNSRDYLRIALQGALTVPEQRENLASAVEAPVPDQPDYLGVSID